MRRAANIVFACIIAGLDGSTTITAWLISVDEYSGVDPLNTFGFILFFGAGFAVIPAILVIAISEIFKLGAWWIFVLSGPLTICILFLPFAPYASLEGYLPWLTATALTGATYWLLAWRIFPPSTVEIAAK